MQAGNCRSAVLHAWFKKKKKKKQIHPPQITETTFIITHIIHHLISPVLSCFCFFPPPASHSAQPGECALGPGQCDRCPGPVPPHPGHSPFLLVLHVLFWLWAVPQQSTSAALSSVLPLPLQSLKPTVLLKWVTWGVGKKYRLVLLFFFFVGGSFCLVGSGVFVKKKKNF